MTEETFERVARTYGDMLYRVAYHALKNRADAEDVTQTVLLKLYQQGDRFESEEHRKHWLLRVAVNESRRLLRSFWRSRAVPLDEQWDAPVSDDPAKRELFRAVMGLETKYRLTIYLYSTRAAPSRRSPRPFMPIRPRCRPGSSGPGSGCGGSCPKKRRERAMFEPNQYRELCSELHVSEEKLEEVIQMTEQEKKRKFHRPMRLGLVAAAVAAMLVVTVSAANSEAIMTYLTSLRDAAVAGEAWADSPVNTEEGTGGLCLPEASLEERDGRTILIVDGVETDVTQALTDQGEYLYECGEGEEQAQVRVYLDEQGAPRLMTSFFTAGEDGGTGAVVVVPADGEE